MPGTRPGRAPAKRAHACSRLRTTKPAGFSASAVIFGVALALVGGEKGERVTSLIDAVDHRGVDRHQRRLGVEIVALFLSLRVLDLVQD